ncbi:MAG: ribosome recycling factor [Spirochaetes bacterium]|nr:ribosome recycling factor [Spirochaetota bacterium]MBN2772260.1 ribosome recycling factor [Spirochaetota bacterium]HRX15295.1 ribosome recycling factor [Spirochaetota bacterium]
MVNDILKDVESRMSKSVKALEKEFVAIRTGRANPSILDSVSIDAYGSPMPLNQVATVSCPEARLIMVQPWDKGNIGAIEKAILKADLNLNPSNDGNVIRIQIPELTEERRKELVKQAKNKAEDCRVAIRNVRRDGNDMVKELEKDKSISEDDSKKEQDNIQKLTDKYTEMVQKLTDNKEKEILSI